MKVSQSERILNFLAFRGTWVDARDLTDISLCYTKRISELRSEGHNIELLDEKVNGMRRTKYRLREKP